MLQSPMRIKAFLSSYRLPILSGFLIGTSYIPFPPWALFFCLVPLFLFWKNAQSARQAFIGGWITQFILTLIGFHWVAYTAVEFGHFPWWGGALTLIGFASIAHLHYPVAGWLAFHLMRKLKLREEVFWLLFPLAFAICDHRFMMIFPWHLGYPWLWVGLPGAQFADVIGFEGLNIATILINGAFAGAWALRNRSIRITLITGAVVLLLLLNLAGLGRAEIWRETDSEVHVLAVQGNIGNFDKLMAERGSQFRDPIIDKYISLTQVGLAAHPQTDLIIWPETAFPDVLDLPYQKDQHPAKLLEFVQSIKVPLLTGSYSYDAKTKDTYNGFFFVNSEGRTPAAPYRKSILLVFGETFPFSEYIPYMDKLFPDLGSFGRGSGPTLLPAGEIRIGPQICYEGLYPWFSASLAQQGAQIFTNVTNDSWFGAHFEPYQHLIMTMARAIEFRRPLIRSTNTGITTVALASGEMLDRSPIGEEWWGVFNVKYTANPGHTIYEKIAGKWIWPLLLSLIALIVFGRKKTRKKK